MFYDPGRDARLEWACQWLDRAEGLRPEIDPDVVSRAAFVLESPCRQLSGRERAAGESVELTLAQGS